MSVEDAIRDLNAPELTTQEKAEIALYEHGPAAKAAVPAIIEILQRDGQNVRTALLHILIAIGPDAADAVPALIQATESPNLHARYLAARAIGGMGPAAKPAVPTLLKLMDDPVTSVRRRATEALGRLGPDLAPEAVPLLIKAMDDPSDPIREQAVIAVGCFGELGKEALPKLQAILTSKTSSVRPEAALSIWRLTQDPHVILPVLIDLLETGDLEWEAAQVMREMGPAAAPPYPT
jgi:HEAT repeat protein